MMSTRRSGFTVIELITVMMIIAIMAKIALTQIGQMTAKTRVQQASSIVASNIQMAYTLAAKRRTPVRISIDTATRVFRIRDRTTPATIYLQQYYNGSSELNLTRLEASDTSLMVFPNGLAAGTLTVTVHTPNNRRQISATRAGQIRITTP